jgi:hypothetical protein
VSDFPRRNQVQKWVPAERAISDAVQAVEVMGADVRLTDAVILLGRAQGRVADFVDGVPNGEEFPRFEPSAQDRVVAAALAEVARQDEAKEPTEENSYISLGDAIKDATIGIRAAIALRLKAGDA